MKSGKQQAGTNGVFKESVQLAIDLLTGLISAAFVFTLELYGLKNTVLFAGSLRQVF